MNRVTAASLAFLIFALAVAGWVLSRPSASAVAVADAAPIGATGAGGLTFAEWSARSDAILLADIDPGAGTSTVPRRFEVVPVRAAPGQPATLGRGTSFSWAAADRVASAASLSEGGFRVSEGGIAFAPPADPLFSDPVARAASDGSADQRVTLRSKSGVITTFARPARDPQSAPYWNRRAIGFLSSDGQLVYVTPDAIVIKVTPAKVE